jgi:hypothetical protein
MTWAQGSRESVVGERVRAQAPGATRSGGHDVSVAFWPSAGGGATVVVARLTPRAGMIRRFPGSGALFRRPGGDTGVDTNSTIVALVAIICGTALVGTVVRAIGRAVVAHRHAAEGLPDETAARIEERLSRIEQAIDAMAVEVERVSEGQRFTTKLLADRNAERT